MTSWGQVQGLDSKRCCHTRKEKDISKSASDEALSQLCVFGLRPSLLAAKRAVRSCVHHGHDKKKCKIWSRLRRGQRRGTMREAGPSLLTLSLSHSHPVCAFRTFSRSLTLPRASSPFRALPPSLHTFTHIPGKTSFRTPGMPVLTPCIACTAGCSAPPMG